MSKVRKIFKNLIVNFSSAIVVSLLSLVFTVITARYLGSSAYGIFSYALSYIAVFIAFHDFGFATVAIRDIAKDPSKTQRYFSNIFSLKLLMAVIIFIAASAAIPLLRKDPLEARILFLFTVSGFIYMFQLSYRWIFQAHQVFEYEALMNISQGIIALVLILTVIFLKKGLVVIAGAWILLYFLTTIIGLVFALRLVRFRFVLDKGLIKGILSSAIVIGLLSLVSILFLYVDKIILFQMKNSQEVGLYSAASKIMLFVRGIVFLYVSVAFPAFSSFSVDMTDRFFHRFLNRSFYYILMLTAAISLGGMLLAAPLISLLFGAGYAGAIPALKIVIWALPLTCLSGLISCSFVSINRQKECLFIYGSGLLVDVLINFLFIGRYGYYATSIAVVISELIMFIVFALLAYRMLEFKISMIKLAQILLSLIIMGLFLVSFHSGGVILSIVFGGLLYLLSLLVFRAVNQDDWTLLKKIILKQI